MADSHFIQNVPVPYMDLETLWSDRRAPHANPLSSGSSGRRGTARVKPDAGLAKTINAIYTPGPFDTTTTGGVSNKRLYQGKQK